MDQIPNPNKKCLAELEEKNIFCFFLDAIEPFPMAIEHYTEGGRAKIKIFQNDHQAHIKIFILQYLSICFNKRMTEIDYLQKIQELIDKT